MATVGEKIKEARKSVIENGKPINQDRFAEMLGLNSYQIISRYENNSTPITVDLLKKISRITGKPISWFFDEEAASPEIKTVADVIETVGKLGEAFGTFYNASPVRRDPFSPPEYYELSFHIPLSYQKVFDEIKKMNEVREIIPAEAANAWLRVFMEEKAKISVEEMLKEVDSDEV